MKIQRNDKNKCKTINIEPKFQVGDYVAPIKKSIYCDFETPSLIINVDIKNQVYIIQTATNKLKVDFLMQDFYRAVIPSNNDLV